MSEFRSMRFRLKPEINETKKAEHNKAPGNSALEFLVLYYFVLKFKPQAEPRQKLNYLPGT